MTEDERALWGFEGLIKQTAGQIVAKGVELEFDDICQLLREKAWQAIRQFDAERAAAGKHLSQLDKRGRTPQQRFVFMCLTNLRYDIEKRRVRRFNQSLDLHRESDDRNPELHNPVGTRADSFDAKYLSVDADEVFAQVEEADELDLPPDLTDVERQVIHLRMRGRRLVDVERELGLSRVQREQVIESVREKLSALDPAKRRSGPMPPLPQRSPRPTRARAALAL